MVDLKFLRNQPDIVAQAIRNKGSTVNLDLVRKLDTERSQFHTEVDMIRAERNKISAAMKNGGPDCALVAKSKELKDKLTKMETLLEDANARFFLPKQLQVYMGGKTLL